MDIDNATRIKNRVIAIERLKKDINSLKRHGFKKGNKIGFKENSPDGLFTFLTLDQPRDVQDVVNFVISQKEEIRDQLIKQINEDF